MALVRQLRYRCPAGRRRRIPDYIPTGDTREVRRYLCSSTRAKFNAVRAELEELLSIEDRDTSRPVIVCISHRHRLYPTFLQSDLAAQMALVAADIWTLLSHLSDGGQSMIMQWVPVHCRLPGNHRRLNTWHHSPDATITGDDGVVTVFDSGYRAQLCWMHQLYSVK